MQSLPKDIELPTWKDSRDFHTDPVRQRSGEVDFGVHWRDSEHRFTTYMLAWINDTGELYLQNMFDSSLAVLAVFKTRDEVEAALEGWEDACGGPGSIEWLMNHPWLGAGISSAEEHREVGAKPRRRSSAAPIEDPSQILYLIGAKAKGAAHREA